MKTIHRRRHRNIPFRGPPKQRGGNSELSAFPPDSRPPQKKSECSSNRTPNPLIVYRKRLTTKVAVTFVAFASLIGVAFADTLTKRMRGWIATIDGNSAQNQTTQPAPKEPVPSMANSTQIHIPTQQQTANPIQNQNANQTQNNAVIINNHFTKSDSKTEDTETINRTAQFITPRQNSLVPHVNYLVGTFSGLKTNETIVVETENLKDKTRKYYDQPVIENNEFSIPWFRIGMSNNIGSEFIIRAAFVLKELAPDGRYFSNNFPANLEYIGKPLKVTRRPNQLGEPFDPPDREKRIRDASKARQEKERQAN